MKIKKIISSLLLSALVMTALPINASDTAPTYDGTGTVISVIDCGFTLVHESFALTDEAPRLTKEASDALIASTSLSNDENTPESVYVSAKIPFAYDYGDNDTDLYHEAFATSGTALISIAAGNGKHLSGDIQGATGIAPEAQVLAMKVYSEKSESISADAVSRAIYDSVTLGADVILIGITYMDVFTDVAETKEINDALEYAKSMGVITVAGAGNAKTYGAGNIWAREYGFAMQSTDSPDIGAVSYFGSFESVLCVGSANSNISRYDAFILGDDQIAYSDSNTLYPAITNSQSFATFFDGKTLEYVITGGIGTAEDLLAAGDLKGKLAVVKRGEITFADKAKNAALVGAIGVIVIDNSDDPDETLATSMDLTGAPIPAILISKQSGNKLAKEKDKHISVKAGTAIEKQTHTTPTPSEYSARGTTPSLTLKPDVCAVGTNVPVAAVDGSYTTFSSTSASAAKVAGICALTKAYLSDIVPDLSPAKLAELVTARVVGSASLMEQISNTVPYSARTQGGGVADASAALGGGLLLTSSGMHKIEAGDGQARVIGFELTLTNLSGTAKECTLDAIVGADGFESYTYGDLAKISKNTEFHKTLGKSENDTLSFVTDFVELSDTYVTVNDDARQLNRASDEYEPLRLVLKPGASTSVRVYVGMSDDTYKTYKKVFKNGFFIEGYMRLASDTDEVTIPFIGFSGSFAASPSLDAEIYSEKASNYDTTYVYRTGDGGGKTILGASIDPETLSVTYDRGKMLFSSASTVKDRTVMMNFALLRSVHNVSVSVQDKNGDTVSTSHYASLVRTYTTASAGIPISEQLTLWDGRAADNPDYVYPDGEYTVTVTYYTPASRIEKSLSYTLTLDSTAPTLVSYELSGNGTASLLWLDVTDNFDVGSIIVTDSSGNAATEIDGAFDISSLDGKYIYIEILDLAGNTTIERIANPGYSSES